MSKYNGKSFISIFLFLCTFIDIACAKEINIAVGWNKPPYVIEKDNSGFEIDMLRSIFKNMGHELNVFYTPVGRSSGLLKKGVVDVGMTISPRADISPAVLSSSYVTYHNVAISLKGRGISINEISQLSKYSVIAFQNASVYLGEEYLTAVDNSVFYIELPDQSKQVAMLLLGRTDVVVMDINIFNYLSKINIKKSLWEGECFVFDNRVSVKHKLSVGSYSMCRGCRMPVSVQEKKSSKYKEGISCPYCYNKLTKSQKDRFSMRQKQILIARKFNKAHIYQKEY